MKKVLVILAAIFTAGSLASCGSEPVVEKGIVIENPVTRSIDSASYKSEVSGKYMTGSFMTITNESDTDITLEGGTSPVAGKIEIHEVVDGMMQPLPNGLAIPAHESVKLRMGGYHVMLLDLDHALKAGEEVEITLQFSDGSTQTITTPVKDIAMDDEVYGVEAGK